jgi:hypothetical protein
MSLFSPPTAAPAPPVWTADQCAEDLVAQVEELLMAGASQAQVVAALETEGLTQPHAQALVGLLAGKVVPGPDPQLGPDAICGMDVAAWRKWLRRGDSPLPLQHALVRQGLPNDVAADIVHDLAEAELAFLDHNRQRLRRLGNQAIVAGVGFTAALCWLAMGPGPHARWHLLTAVGTLGLVAYGVVLRQRHRE